MDFGAQMTRSYSVNTWIINKQADGLTHAESVIQLPFRANCFNWVLGHILVGRGNALNVLGADPILSEEQSALYVGESEPIESAEQAVPIEVLLAAVAESQEKLAAALEVATEEQLDSIFDEERGQTVAGHVRGQHWHETFHLGQLEILRQAAGKDDKVI